MPCESVAVVSAKINAKTLEELLISEQAREAVRQYIETVLGEKVETQVNEKSLRYYSSMAGTTVTVGASGVNIRAYSSRYGNDANVQKISELADQIALASVKERMVQRIKSRYVIKSDVQVDGARMLQVSL